MGARPVSSVSLACAVTSVSDPMSRVSAALATRTLLRAVMSASCALPSVMTERSESDSVTTPARVRAMDVFSCSCACCSCACAAPSASRAARMA
jgi:hypothetical protein